MADARSKNAELAAEANLPAFARIAVDLLEKGDPGRALRLCQEGTRRFPNYATGYLVMGKCYQAAGRRIEAIMEYRRVLHVFPDNTWVLGLLERVEQEEEKEFHGFVSTRRRSRPASGPAWSPAEHPGSVVKGAGPGQAQDSVEFLLRKLEDVQRTQPPAEERRPEDRSEPGSSVIVTPTLAEIYAGQKEYAEAARMYRVLIAQKPEDREKYATRLLELEELARSAGEAGEVPGGGEGPGGTEE